MFAARPSKTDFLTPFIEASMNTSERLFLWVAAAVLAAGSASARAADPPARAGAQPSQAADKSVAASDLSFMTTAAGAGLYEVEVSKLAAGKTSNAELKKYAEMLVQHHSAANEELKVLAKLKGVELPAALPADKKAKIAALDKMSGDAFDKAYVQKVGIGDHETDIKLFEKAASGAKDAEIKAFASKTLPVLKQHLSSAKAMAKGGKQG
jgi:putative membrane protein